MKVKDLFAIFILTVVAIILVVSTTLIIITLMHYFLSELACTEKEAQLETMAMPFSDDKVICKKLNRTTLQMEYFELDTEFGRKA